MMRFICLTTIAFIFSTSYAKAQAKKTFEWQQVDLNTFVLPDSAYLEGAAAVYLADVGNSEYKSHSSGKFTLHYHRHLRIKIVNNNGFDAATFSIPLYRRNQLTEKIEGLKATTYNLVDGKIVATDLDKDQIFTDKKSKRFWLEKFTMPALKAGSIVDVEYSLVSDFDGELPGWYFQGKYPVIWSEYKVSVPVGYNFTTILQSRLKFYINEKDTTNYSDTDVLNNGHNGRYENRRLVAQHVRGLQEEPYTSNPINHVARITFSTNRFGAWTNWVQPFNDNEYFGADIYKKNKWLEDDINTIMGNCCADDTLARAKKIYAYLRDSIACISDDGIMMSEPGLQKTIKNRKGNAADINLLLVAMLNHEHIACSPVVVSTKENGRVNGAVTPPQFYNLTIAAALINKKVYYLDASDPALGFGKLNTNCYNGHARIIRGQSLGIYLEPDSIRESDMSKLSVRRLENGKWSAVLTKQLGYYESLALRHSLKKKTQEELIADLIVKEPGIVTPRVEIKYLENRDVPVTLLFTGAVDMSTQDNLQYFSPLPGEDFSVNPFKSAQREYPVELPYKIEKIYDSEIDIPDGYVIEEVPENLQILLHEGQGLFEYLVTKTDKKLIVHTRLLLHKTTYPPAVYGELREFFAEVVHKHNEQIVIRKK